MHTKDLNIDTQVDGQQRGTIAAHPCWSVGVPLVRLPGNLLRVGSELESSAVVDGCDDAVFDWLAQLDGRCSWSHQLLVAAACGVEFEVARRLLADLSAIGLLVDAAGPVDPFAALPDISVAIIGSGSVANELHRQLPDRVIGVCQDVDRSASIVDIDVTASSVVCFLLRGTVADRTELAVADNFARRSIPYIVAGVGARSMRVGPFVWPGTSACLRCEDESRTDIDPHWPSVNVSLTLHNVAAADGFGASCAANEVIRELRAFARACAGDRARTGDGDGLLAVNEVREAECLGGPWRRRTVARHPACGCGWS